MKTQIIGTGSSLPEIHMTNDDIAKLVDTNDEWITSRTGIKSRHIASREGTADLAIAAALRAMEMANITADELDLIIVATVSADNLVYSTACQVQSALHASNAFAFDLNAACSGFIFATSIADSYMQNGTVRTALVIGVETLSKLMDWNDRSCCILFGDGGGAAVLRRQDGEAGIRTCLQRSDGEKGNVLTCKSRPLNNPYVKNPTDPSYLYMNGQEVFRFAVKNVPRIIQDALTSAGLTVDDIDVFLLHQANIRILQAIGRKLSIPMEKIPVNLDRCGNTSAASLPILLDECLRDGTIRTGDTILLSGFGAGLTWGAMIITL